MKEKSSDAVCAKRRLFPKRRYIAIATARSSTGLNLDTKYLSVSNDLTAKGEGTKEDVEKADGLESNVIVACNKLVRDSDVFTQMLKQAQYLHQDILDFIVMVELCHQLPFIKVLEASDSILDGVGIKRARFESRRSNVVLTCVYKSYVFNGGSEQKDSYFGAHS